MRQSVVHLMTLTVVFIRTDYFPAQIDSLFWLCEGTFVSIVHNLSFCFLTLSQSPSGKLFEPLKRRQCRRSDHQCVCLLGNPFSLNAHYQSNSIRELFRNGQGQPVLTPWSCLGRSIRPFTVTPLHLYSLCPYHLNLINLNFKQLLLCSVDVLWRRQLAISCTHCSPLIAMFP